MSQERLNNDTLWQTLEEKMMLLISENERLQKEVTTLKFEREEHAKRIYNLISLIDSVNKLDNTIAAASMMSQPKPILVQG